MSAVRIRDRRLGKKDAAVIARFSVAEVNLDIQRLDRQRSGLFRRDVVIVLFRRPPGDLIGVVRGAHLAWHDTCGGNGGCFAADQAAQGRFRVFQGFPVIHLGSRACGNCQRSPVDRQFPVFSENVDELIRNVFA